LWCSYCAPRLALVGGSMFWAPTYRNTACSGLSLKRLRMTYTNWPTLMSRGTRYLRSTPPDADVGGVGVSGCAWGASSTMQGTRSGYLPLMRLLSAARYSNACSVLNGMPFSVSQTKEMPKTFNAMKAEPVWYMRDDFIVARPGEHLRERISAGDPEYQHLVTRFGNLWELPSRGLARLARRAGVESISTAVIKLQPGAPAWPLGGAGSTAVLDEEQKAELQAGVERVLTNDFEEAGAPRSGKGLMLPPAPNREKMRLAALNHMTLVDQNFEDVYSAEDVLRAEIRATLKPILHRAQLLARYRGKFTITEDDAKYALGSS
jgi:hypothetical protein